APFQKYFYNDFVEPFLLENNKVFVVISDGLRYEIAQELTDLIRHEERYEATLKPMWSMLPSYTQLGMAALLPNNTLSFSDSMTGAVDVDGNSAQGTENRGKILADKVPAGGLAMQMDEFTALNVMDARTLIRENDVIYFYHNRIDSTGDKRLTETKVFEAVQDTQDELLKFIYKLVMANANNILITADHGFIYQNRPIDESEFASVNVEGDTVFYKDRRFAIGKGLKEQDSLMKFTAKDLSIDSDVEIQIPKANNRLRLKGAGSRYVHGGASLQELVVPVIHVHKLRNGEVRKVEVDVLGRGSQRITTGQFTATLYQREPVSENVHPRHLRVGLYTLDDMLISDRHEVICSSSSENAQDREYPLQFILTSQAETANNQDVVLKLEEPIPETSHYQEYKALKYQLNRSIGSDFDF
ncbi:MAG: BREX-1 system phosphatase PglZ type A, partial [Chloroflexota bacterium]|nr:BREX-1 system phosphatase PglZ type A [Chloroflexota bacterium]